MGFREALAKSIAIPYVTRHRTGFPLGLDWAHMKSEIILHARHEHGGFPIHVLPDENGSSFRVEWPEGPTTYPSVRQMLIALYNQGSTSPDAKDPGMSFDRYFRRGEYAPVQDDVAGDTIFDLFLADEESLTPTPPEKIPGIRRRTVKSRGRRRRPVSETSRLGITALMLFAAPEEPLSVETPTAEVVEMPLSVPGNPEPVLGIDLAKRGHEVRKLLFAGFGHKMRRGGYNPDDVLQEVYRGILARNKGTCPFDARKSSFGHYVHMVCGCVLANYHRKKSRMRSFEQVGMYNPLSDDGYTDAAEAAVDMGSWDGHRNISGPELSVGQEKAILSLQEHILSVGEGSSIAPLAAEMVPLVFVGMTRSEIAVEKGLSPAKVGRALACMREATTEWASDHDLVV